ncbi:MAG: hypothetical protein AUG49_20345 [Catenulispora sp. 13_1_20CM_3_70_7]|nr:MAG: hypothetical protein AUG49_20345 [Catenulispora sp. 13_1_20CM_3_70_7]
MKVEQTGVLDWKAVEQWAADEGWNPGAGDALLFQAVDPAGFLIGTLNGRLVSAISVVNYDEHYAHIGYFLVTPSLRGLGIGTATWSAAIGHAGDRAIGLDAVPEQVDRYSRHGFRPAWRTIRFTGPVPAQPPLAGGNITEPTTPDLGLMATLDAACFPAGHVDGYGVLRRAWHGWRIGPLYAESPKAAAALFDALCDRAQRLKATGITIDVPETNRAALDLAEAHGLSHAGETIRMYRPGRTGLRPTGAHAYGLTSLEVG